MKLIAFAAYLAASMAFAQSRPAFEVASVKKTTEGPNPGDIPRNMDTSPGHFAMYNVPLRYAMQWAYSIQDYEISGPDWIKGDERYDIVAKAASPVPTDELRVMLQTLLTERFQIKMHKEQKELSCYVLSLGKGAHKLKRGDANGEPSLGAGMPVGHALFTNQPISRFTFMLTRRLGRPVLDMTGLRGVYSFSIDTTGMGFNGNPPPPDSTGPSIFTAVQNDLGLKLEAKKEQIDILVIDSVQRTPTQN